MSVRVIQGDVRDELPKLPADSFDCIVTSPPYYGLRDYGCEGQIGLEPTLDAYLETMVAVCRELRRVLKPSGVFFLNIGDSYAGSGKGGNPPESKHKKQATNAGSLSIGDIVWKSGPPYKGPIDTTPREFGIKQKDLMLVPERLGIALQADGWWVRSRIVWAKPNPMPESVTDRPTNAHETVWMLTKSARYLWDGEAVKEETTFSRPNNMEKASPKTLAMQDNGTHGKGGNLGGINLNYDSRNLRNVWTIASHPFPGAHFATFPPALVERCIKAGSSERGCCPACGAPWDRVVETERVKHAHPPGPGGRANVPGSETSQSSCFRTGLVPIHTTIGWQPSCKCHSVLPFSPIPARILDPFAGSGTVGLVGDRLGRDATLIDLNTSYIDMAVDRIRDDSPLFAEVAAE